MRMLLAMAFVVLSAGFVVSSIGVDGISALKLETASLSALGPSGAVVMALLAPALGTMIVLLFSRIASFFGRHAVATVAVLAIGAVGLLAAMEAGLVPAILPI